MKIKDILKKQTAVVALAIVLVALALIGVSYAIFFDVKANEKNQVITAGTLKLTVTSESELTNISGDSLVMVNDIGKVSTPIATYTINHTADTTLPSSYSIYLDLQNENIIDYVKLSIDGKDILGIEDLDILNIDNKNYYKIDASILLPGATASTKELRLWLDEDMITEDIKEESVTINLYVITEVAETVADIINNSKLGEGTPNFANTSCTAGTNSGSDCEEETIGLYCWDVDTNLQCIDTTTNKTYFYRGDVEDNYVKFAGFYWRIIRINENGTIRMIYAGEVDTIDNLPNKEEVLKNGYDDSSTKYTQIGASAFNTNFNQAEYVGFKYTLGSVHGTDTKSTVLEYLEKWYNRNLTNYKTDEDGNFIDENNSITTNPIIDSNKIDYSTHIDNEAGFCGDRTAYTDSNGTTEGGGTGTTETHYGAYIRLIKHNPTFECLNEEDLYNVRVGLITSDEVIFAGGKYYGPNYNYYLYTGNWYWTLSPNVFNGADAHVSIVDYDGDASVIDVDDSYSGVRPVINLSADKLTISGSGTIESPYVIN